MNSSLVKVGKTEEAGLKIRRPAPNGFWDFLLVFFLLSDFEERNWSD